MLFKSAPLAALKSGSVLNSAVCDQEGKKLLGQGVPVTSELLARLNDRGVRSVLLSERDVAALSAFKPQGKSKRILPSRPGIFVDLHTDASRVHDSLAEDAASMINNSPGNPLSNQIENRGATTYEADEQEVVLESHELAINQLDDFLECLKQGGTAEIEQVTSLATDAVKQAAEDLDLYTCLGINPYNAGYPTRHSVHVAKLAVAIGVKLGLDQENLEHLSVGCLIHDMGMLMIDQRIVQHKQWLPDGDFVEIVKHPLKTFDMLEQNLDAIPAGARMVAYQMHERCNGSGYPRKRTTSNIHPLARVAAVADSYVALTTPRPHRSGVLPYHALKAILDDVRRGQYESDVVRALLAAVSLFPLGSYIKLSDDRIGRVLRANEKLYDRPVIDAWDKSKGPEHSTLIDLSEEPELSVVCPIASA